ncbi:UNVERIFIED_CONTAM: hypothetical protein K2H54_026767 [Gekko kuhli]
MKLSKSIKSISLLLFIEWLPFQKEDVNLKERLNCRWGQGSWEVFSKCPLPFAAEICKVVSRGVLALQQILLFSEQGRRGSRSLVGNCFIYIIYLFTYNSIYTPPSPKAQGG